MQLKSLWIKAFAKCRSKVQEVQTNSIPYKHQKATSECKKKKKKESCPITFILKSLYMNVSTTCITVYRLTTGFHTLQCVPVDSALLFYLQNCRKSFGFRRVKSGIPLCELFPQASNHCF